ncbi:PLP-dependent transferase [Metschnikowia bicuspidata var. bicuspidata NRRL YB-4993]|uniref:PLP-dependent transferase n=1 Tax=Metschnikowia bicuspidata var. bicuspidata NRRL YB-4993 TaxID=869754 RepID=A0A1A0HAP8_9ASCO|nr:PLP-dependent transferase [Metschnikowia bicuspidata var. bicuspidata NRRL YB-4993]OBA21199.1 PLP-dependent transferase [Metschnikowia bicuspidata var. bicuspidata NRRL YB-4993]
MSTLIPDAPYDPRAEGVKADLEYGALTSKEYLYVSKHPVGEPLPTPIDDEPPYLIHLATLLSYLILIIIGHIRDFFGKIFKPQDYEDLVEKDGYAPWYDGFENFYVRRLKTRIDDCFARPVHGAPGRYIKCFERTRKNKDFTYLGQSVECLNLSSYNYLGFAQSHGVCTDNVLLQVNKLGTSSCSPRNAIGTTALHVKCEKVIADFVGKEDALIVSQGYGTNASLFASLVDSQSLVISDSLNHASTRFGIRLSGAIVKVFKHNDMKDLEKLIRNQIAQGQPKTHRPWKKIIIAVEGLYSMEGNMVNLPAVVQLKEKYKCYLFVDEAHSIGALGPQGRGICDYFLVDPKDVDILMGTLTKSFGATGGYIAADKWIIDKLRLSYLNNSFGEGVPPPVLEQIISSLSVIDGSINPGEGEERLKRIAFNSRYLRLGLKKLGFIVYGADDSPVIPLLLYLRAKMPAISRMLYSMKIAVVIVGYPATPITTARVRLCVSSALTKEDLDYVLRKFSEVGDTLYLKNSSGIAGGSKLPGARPRMSIEDVLATNVSDCKLPVLF